MHKYKNVRNDITIHKNRAVIEFYRSGIKHKLNIPFKSSHKFKSDKFYLITNQNEEILEHDITHMPGIPYFLSAEHLQGEYIIKKNIDKIYKFEKHEVPDLDK